jgi:hypothetical protein
VVVDVIDTVDPLSWSDRPRDCPGVGAASCEGSVIRVPSVP